jgi:hypothetical protein
MDGLLTCVLHTLGGATPLHDKSIQYNIWDNNNKDTSGLSKVCSTDFKVVSRSESADTGVAGSNPAWTVDDFRYCFMIT